MQLTVGPVDVSGNLWLIRPGPPAETSGSALVLPDRRSDLRMMRHLAVDAAVADALEGDRCVTFFESGGTFAPRIARLTRQLEDLGIVSEWHWTDTTARASSLFIDEDRAAVAWFLTHSADILFVSSVSFEKQARAAPSWLSRLRWARRALAARARA